MGMDGSGLSVADALALQRDNDDGMFGGNGSWVFFLFFLLAWGGGGFFGNNVHADQIRSRRVYHTNVATDTGLFVVSACELCKTGFNFPTIPA